jgi:hypothetical protein
VVGGTSYPVTVGNGPSAFINFSWNPQ